MEGVRHRATTEPVELTVHNEGASAVEIRCVVHADDVAVRSTALRSGETDALSAPAGSSVEVHAPGGTATATAARGAFFVIRDGRVLVAPK